jgi:hypothetical protein
MACDHMGVNRHAYRILVAKVERMRLHGRCKHRCEAKNRTNFKEIEWENTWLKIGTSGRVL